MNIGVDVANFLVANAPNTSAIIKSETWEFLQHVQQFYIEAALQIQQRFPLNDDILKSLTVLNPDVINSISANEITALATKFPNVIAHDELGQLDNEWRQLQFMDPADLPEFNGRRHIWRSDNKGIQHSKLMKSLLWLPHSNTDVERTVFSLVEARAFISFRLLLASFIQERRSFETGI